MRQTSELYKQLRTQTGSYYEVKVVRGDVTYGMDKLKSITIEQAMFDGSGPQIGGVYSSQCRVKLLEQSDNWPRAASFEVLIRITDGAQSDLNWLSMGRFYTDERHADKHGNLDIIAFDGMLLLEQPWTDKVLDLPSSWPVTAQKACDMIQESLGVQFDGRNVLDNTVSFIGMDTTSTARETLSTVAAGLGGNWVVTAENKLRLILLERQSELSAIAGIAIVGDSLPGVGIDTAIVGTTAKSVNVGQVLDGITAAELQTSSGVVAYSRRGTGYTLKGNCDFSNSGVSDLLLDNTFGYMYKPFTATGARLDPATEVGDSVFIDGNMYQICSISWNIGPHITANVSAPYEEAVDHEYPIINESAKTLRKAMGYADGLNRETYSYFQQLADSIKAGVAETYISDRDLSEALANYQALLESEFASKDETANVVARVSSLEQTSSDFQISVATFQNSVTGQLESVTSYIRYDGTDVIVGVLGKPTSVRISDERIGLYYGNEEVSTWNQQRQYTPKELQIPVGGKFILGNILMQPRSTGNMSFMWVDDLED